GPRRTNRHLPLLAVPMRVDGTLVSFGLSCIDFPDRPEIPRTHSGNAVETPLQSFWWLQRAQGPCPAIPVDRVGPCGPHIVRRNGGDGAEDSDPRRHRDSTPHGAVPMQSERLFRGSSAIDTRAPDS